MSLFQSSQIEMQINQEMIYAKGDTLRYLYYGCHFCVYCTSEIFADLPFRSHVNQINLLEYGHEIWFSPLTFSPKGHEYFLKCCTIPLIILYLHGCKPLIYGRTLVINCVNNTILFV